MMTTENLCAAESNDAELVAECLAGGREAFRQIVERNQTLVCSLAYCATGSLTRSEDLAQETFLAAWRQLAELREPSKLRPWLCGMARFVIGKELRRQGREPVHAAESLESVNELAAPEPLPSERAISKEEQAILWHCVARVPELYREPLVLFYRENQSIGRVAEALELSEDAVKQRLARGRKLLQEQALAYLEGALQNTKPGRAFTAGVLAVLPLSATSAKAVAAGAAVKGGSTAKTVASLAALGAIILYWSLLGFLAFAGGCAGYWMSRTCWRSFRQCEFVIRFWRTLAAGCAVFLVIPQLYFMWSYWHIWELHAHSLPAPGQPANGWIVWKLCPDLFCSLAVVALAIWLRRWWREWFRRDAVPQQPAVPLKKRFFVWLSLGMIGPAGMFGLLLASMLFQAFGPANVQPISESEAQRLIQEIKAGHKDAEFLVDAECRVVTEEDGTKTLRIVLPENFARLHFLAKNLPWLGYAMSWSGIRVPELSAVANDSTLKLLDKNTTAFKTGPKFKIGPKFPLWREEWRFEWMLPFFVAPMGAVVLVCQTGKRRWETAAPGTSENQLEPSSRYGEMLLALHTDPTAWRNFGLVFAAVFLLAFCANAITAIGLYVVLFVGAVKGAFFGLVAGAVVLYLRTRRKVSKASVKKE